MADYTGLFIYLCLAAAIVAVIVAISGSLSARLAEKKLLDRWFAAASLALMVSLASL